MKRNAYAEDSVRLANFFYPDHSTSVSISSPVETILAERRDLFDFLQEIQNIPPQQRALINSDGVLFGRIPEKIFTQECSDFIHDPKIRLKQCLRHAVLQTSSYATGRFVEEGSQTLGEYLQYLKGLELLDDADIRTIFSPLSSSSSASAHSLAEAITMNSPDFFREFLPKFKETRARCSAAFEQNQFAHFRSPLTIQGSSVAEYCTKTKLAALADTKRPIISTDRFDHDFSSRITLADVAIDISETIGSEISRKQEDALIIGKSKNFASRDVAVELQESFQKIGAEIREKATDILTGSTAILAHYSPEHKLTIANCGDSRAVLYVRRPNGDIDHVRLTNDHDPEDVLENARIKSLGGSINRGRVLNSKKSALAIARSFGDETYQGTTSATSDTNHLISYEPDIFEYDINKFLADGSELFLIVSCDGLYTLHHQDSAKNWQYLCENSYSAALKTWFSDPALQTKYQDNVAHYLQDFAVINRSTDNVTVCCANITEAPEQAIIMGVFDGHGGDLISHTLAAEFGNQLLLEEERLIYPPEAQSILRMTEEETQSIRSSQDTEVLDLDDLEEIEEIVKEEERAKSPSQEPILGRLRSNAIAEDFVSEENEKGKRKRSKDEDKDIPSTHPRITAAQTNSSHKLKPQMLC